MDWESVKSSKALIDYTRLTIYQGFKQVLMNNDQVPTISEWGEIDKFDYDLQYAFDKYIDKSIDEMVEMLRSSLMERAFELQYMPDKVFNYYILGLKNILK